MGKGKKNRKAKRAEKAKQRREIRIKMGKPTYLTLIRCPRPITEVANHYTYKATIYRTNVAIIIMQTEINRNRN